MQGMVVVCSILWDVFVRFVWYSYGVGRGITYCIFK